MTRENAIERCFWFIYPTWVSIIEKVGLPKTVKSASVIWTFTNVQCFTFNNLHVWHVQKLSRCAMICILWKTNTIHRNESTERGATPSAVSLPRQNSRQLKEIQGNTAHFTAGSTADGGLLGKNISVLQMVLEYFNYNSIKSENLLQMAADFTVYGNPTFFNNRCPGRINEPKVPLNRVFSCHLLEQAGLQSTTPYLK